jgi:hypothetical protein
MDSGLTPRGAFQNDEGKGRCARTVDHFNKFDANFLFARSTNG